MPYKTTKDLPVQLNHLPEHAKSIFLHAFNNAWDEYSDPSKRKSGSSHEETAFRVAWAAVKKKYKKDKDNNWIEK